MYKRYKCFNIRFCKNKNKNIVFLIGKCLQQSHHRVSMKVCIVY